MLEQPPALLVTKLYMPRPRSAQVARPHLWAALDAGLERRLILVAAAAGFGKTTLVADWSAARDDTAWLSLDEGDNDPARFLAYLIAAIQTRYPQVGVELLAALGSPQPPAPQNVVHSLINQLAALPGRLVLVLDDYHVIDNAAVHTALTFLLDHLPLGVTLVLLTRADPPLPLARLRARDDLLELRAADLRFSVEEGEQFLNGIMRLGLSTESLQALESRTEGWIAGLGLAALAMRASPEDKEAFVRAFTGSNRFILDYLIEEVLSVQPDDVRHFLLHTAFLRRLNGDLCSAVTGIPDGQAMLERLERGNLFLIPLDSSRYWYRYHHLFADLLRARFQADDPDLLPELNRRAADWHERHNLPEEAVIYALEGRDFEGAARLITGAASGVARRSEVTTLMEWYRAFPPEMIGGYPGLAAHFGLAFALNGRWEEAETLLKTVEAGESGTRSAESLHLAYLVANYRQDMARLAAVEAEAAAHPHPSPAIRLVLAMAVSLRDDFARACDLLAEAQDGAERAGDLTVSLTALFQRCRLLVFLGKLHQAHDLCQAALEQFQTYGNALLPMAAFAHVSLGRIYIEWNQPDRARDHLQQTIRLAELSGFVTGMISSATMMLAEAAAAQGDTSRAAGLAADAIILAERYDPPPEVAWLRTYQARVWLATGDLASARDWLRDSTPGVASLFYPTRILLLTQARVMLASRKTETAVTTLTRLAAEPADLLSVEVLATLALARAAGGDSVHALLTLEQALALAEGENRLRAFLDLGAPMAKLLARYAEAHPGDAFVDLLLAAFSTQADTGYEPLSQRELDILRLIVAGHSNEEIAASLTLALSTVKWYINTLYAKLGVKSRSQAIALAHERKLLS